MDNQHFKWLLSVFCCFSLSFKIQRTKRRLNKSDWRQQLCPNSVVFSLLCLKPNMIMHLQWWFPVSRVEKQVKQDKTEVVKWQLTNDEKHLYLTFLYSLYCIFTTLGLCNLFNQTYMKREYAVTLWLNCSQILSRHIKSVVKIWEYILLHYAKLKHNKKLKKTR